MSRIININEPQQSDAEKVIIALTKQVHLLTAAVLQLQHEMKEVQQQLNPQPESTPEDFVGEKL